MRETKYWILNLASALVLLALLAPHMFGMHLDGLIALLVPEWAEPLAWKNVVARGSSVLHTTGYVVLLGAGLFHGLFGVRTILVEHWSGRRAERLIAAGCWIAGLALFAIGTATTLVFHLGQR